ncbi:leucine-rich repeat-containing protein 59 [Scaptodrosophila lebanonensis]|uniref:Leucine-rich repeat-containing protein 59 n=1 Tax=Drosophila lebanonensis TaxID=7225 RepID=A0A6J2UB80_DROLE|nr:leucine-rich repeat-containing protein 59 [Scaptodrosophila lebanonensis]
MPKGVDKVKVNVKERVDDDSCDLSLSELSEIPVRDIASFKRITTLDLSSNRLVTLGHNFTTLTRLAKLDLSKNQIRFLPEDFGQLEHLRHLDLYDNRLEHLPISFGRLRRLRYLDLKGNPLAPAWEKIVGRCSTLKDCHQAAKNTVSVCANLKPEFIERERLAHERQQNAAQMAGGGDGSNSSASQSTQANGAAAKKGAGKQSKKSKSKKSNNSTDNELTIKPVLTSTKPTTQKSNQKRKTHNVNWFGKLNGAAMFSLVAFLLLFIVNVLLIYMIMFKNPDIAEKLVEFIPPQYRDWILTKTEIFRLRVTDWISEFRTPPEEH